MIRDFTFGQFFPGNSILHRLDPRTKLLWTIAYIVLLFVCDAWISYLVPFLYLVLVIWISKISWVIVLRGVKPRAAAHCVHLGVKYVFCHGDADRVHRIFSPDV